MTELPEYLKELELLSEFWCEAKNMMIIKEKRCVQPRFECNDPEAALAIEKMLDGLPQILSDFKKMAAEREEMIECLEFYADAYHYLHRVESRSVVLEYSGDKARTLIAKMKGKEK